MLPDVGEAGTPPLAEGLAVAAGSSLPLGLASLEAGGLGSVPVVGGSSSPHPASPSAHASASTPTPYRPRRTSATVGLRHRPDKRGCAIVDNSNGWFSGHTDAARRRPRWTPRPLVVALAAAQLLLPASLLASRWVAEGSQPVSEYPASYQVYSTFAEPSYTGVTADGTRRDLDEDALPVVVRRVGTGDVVPDRLCDRHPDLVAVERRRSPDDGRFPC